MIASVAYRPPSYQPMFLAEVARRLEEAGALEPELATWGRREGGVFLSGVKLDAPAAVAFYACGCWIAWGDKQGVELPAPTYDGDEVEFAELHLGRQLGERACRKHGGPRAERTAASETKLGRSNRAPGERGQSGCPAVPPEPASIEDRLLEDLRAEGAEEDNEITSDLPRSGKRERI